jgi:hypothetical protein
MNAEPENAEAGPSDSQAWPTAPMYDLSHRPTSIAEVDMDNLMSGVRHNFFRQAQWSVSVNLLSCFESCLQTAGVRTEARYCHPRRIVSCGSTIRRYIYHQRGFG